MANEKRVGGLSGRGWGEDVSPKLNTIPKLPVLPSSSPPPCDRHHRTVGRAARQAGSAAHLSLSACSISALVRNHMWQQPARPMLPGEHAGSRPSTPGQ